MNKTIDCPLCSSKNKGIEIYNYSCDAGPVLGRISITHAMCDFCGFVYNNPRPPKDLIDQHYQGISSGTTFNENTRGTRINKLINERTAFIYKHLPNKKIGMLIDIGCGSGELLKALNINKISKTGLDPSQENRISQDRLIQFMKGGFEDLDWHDNEYDVILNISSLEHYYYPNKAISIFSKILKNDGLLFIEIPNSLAPINQISDFYSFEHLSHFTKYTISKMLKNFGLAVIEFDENISIPNLRLVAQKKHIKTISLPKDDRDKYLITIQKYKNERKNKIDNILKNIMPQIESIRKSGHSIAIFGAGIHSNFLYDIINLNKYVSAFIDSDPKKWGSEFKSKKVYAPHEIPQMKIGGILISSHDYEQEIFDTIQRYNKNKNVVIKCYGK